MICSSFSYPNIFDVSRSKVNIYNDLKSITNRVKLLILTEPGELYLNPNFGVGLSKYMFTYNNDNTIALIKDKLIEQLELWEPSVIASETEVTRGLNYSDPDDAERSSEELNKLELTITLKTVYMQTVSFGINQNDLNHGFI